MTDTLALGEYGGTTNAVGRWLELAGFAVLALGAATVLYRSAGRLDARARGAIALIAGTAAGTVAGHAVAALSNFDLFDQRYLTILIPIAGNSAWQRL